MVVGLISNPTALSVGANLAAADNDLQASAKRISSGNKIANAYDDVAGLAIGSILSGNVSTLKAALINTSQGMSMLGIADGALKNQGDILQRMKYLATQANSGVGADSAQKLNLEFQNLVDELDSIANGTNFGGKKLIDGSLYAPAKIATSTKTDATQAKAKITINTALAPANGNFNFIYINDAAMPFANQVDIGTASSGTEGDLADITVNTTTNTTTIAQAQALYNAIQTALNYAGTDNNVLKIKSQLSKMQFSYKSGDGFITVTSNVAGSVGNGVGTNTVGNAIFGVAAKSAGTNDILLNGANASDPAFTSANGIGIGFANNGYAPLQVAQDGDLNGGTFPLPHTSTDPNIQDFSAYSGTARTVAQGTVTDTLLKALNPSNVGTLPPPPTGIDVSLISNNANFIGNLKGFQVEYSGQANVVNMSLKVGDYTYMASNINTNLADKTAVTFASVGGQGGSFTLTFAANNISVQNQNDASLIATRLDSAFKGITFYQKRNISGYQAAGTVLDINNNVVGDLAGSNFKFISSEFNNIEIASISVKAPVQGSDNATISLTTKDGEVYISGYKDIGNVQPLGKVLAQGDYGFVSQSNPKNILIFHYQSSAQSLDIRSDSGAQATEKALEKAFGINTGAASSTFQVGLTPDDNVMLAIKGTKTSDIFLDQSGNAVTLDISDLQGANNASAVLDRAITYVSDSRSNVGATQAKLQFAANNLQTGIQNLSSARDVFLATDIPNESTDFAMAQVREQASTSVLAQINQLRHGILKLLDR